MFGVIGGYFVSGRSGVSTVYHSKNGLIRYTRDISLKELVSNSVIGTKLGCVGGGMYRAEHSDHGPRCFKSIRRCEFIENIFSTPISKRPLRVYVSSPHSQSS